MRVREEKDGLSVHAIAGTRVVLLGLDIAPKLRKGLLGFTILRTGPDPKNPIRRRTIPLKGGRHFAGADAWIDARMRAQLTGQSDRHPIQAFLWGDYIAKPGVGYVYEVAARYGKPGALTDGPRVRLEVATEAEEDGTHAVYFNRGVAGSQYYARTFDAWRRYYRKMGRWRPFIRPDDVPERRAFQWLSRGLEEAMLDFVAQARDSRYALRVNAFELTYPPFIKALAAAAERGVDVQATYHAAQKSLLKLKGGASTDRWIAARKTITEADWTKLLAKLQMTEVDDSTAEENHAAIAGLSFADPVGDAEGPDAEAAHAALRKRVDAMLKPRRKTGGFSHNKVIVLLKDGKPLQVWTGSTNYTEGGIFGQSNVGHVVRDPAIAEAYLAYWRKLHADPDRKALGAYTVEAQPDLDGSPPEGVTPVFSPRETDAMLDWYAERFAAAKDSVFFTAAFSVAQQIYAAATDPGGPSLRYLMLEKEKAKDPLKSMKAAHPKAPSLDAVANNRLAWGDTLEAEDEGEEDMIEVLTGLNTFVDYLHTKYMLIDPLSDDPIVITGSANFSTNSTVNNDENMLVIRGNTRVADIYLGEFMRLFNHFRIRNELNAMSDAERARTRHLDETDAWTAPYFDEDGQLARERRLFSGAPAPAPAATPAAAPAAKTAPQTKPAKKPAKKRTRKAAAPAG